MRLFKANPSTQSEEDRVRDLRLTAIASRYRPRAHHSIDGAAPEPAKAEGPEALQ